MSEKQKRIQNNDSWEMTWQWKVKTMRKIHDTFDVNDNGAIAKIHRIST